MLNEAVYICQKSLQKNLCAFADFQNETLGIWSVGADCIFQLCKMKLCVFAKKEIELFRQYQKSDFEHFNPISEKFRRIKDIVLKLEYT